MPTPLVILNLTTFNSNLVDTLFSCSSEQEVMAAFYEHSPWDECWRIQTIGQRSYMVDSKNITEFVLMMKCSVHDENPKVLITSIAKSLSNYWIIKTETGVISLYQEIFALRPPTRTQHPTLGRYVLSPILDISTEQKIPPTVPIPYWEIIIVGNPTERTLSLNKPFFCSQIVLNADEYDIISAPFLMIRYTSSQRLFFETEIVVRDKGREIQVCLDDSDFDIINGKVESQHYFKRIHLLWLVFVKVFF